MVLEFQLSGGCSSQSFLEVIDFLLQFDDLVLFFVQKNGVIHNPMPSLLVLYRILNLPLHQTFNLVLKKEQSSVVRILLVGLYKDMTVRSVLLSEGQQDVFEFVKDVDV